MTGEGPRGRAAIIGGGVIGGGWAARFLLNGWDVAVFDPAPDAERKVQEVIAQARRSLPALYETRLPPEGKLRFTLNLADAVCNADWVQESVPERLTLKHQVLREIQSHAPGGTPVGSSTSGFKPSELQENAADPARIFVAHPFNPVYLLPLVELVGDEDTLSSASETLKEIGMKPLVVRKEIDAHIADRFLEAVWREALWLVKDDVATTEEIDDAIRFGFGLRWAQMGLFETYRIAGGEDGMAHFIEQFGPCLKWPWTKLMDVPDLDDALVRKIADQSDAQSGSRNIRDLERVRDDNLVAMMRALKWREWGAGKLLNEHDARLRSERSQDVGNEPITSVERVVPIDWTDYNGHMNESRYGQVFSDAADTIMGMIGADADYVAKGLSYFTVDTHTTFIDECRAGEAIHIHTFIVQGEGKKLRLFHQMKRGDDIVATCNQLLIHVSLETRRSCEPGPTVSAKLAELVAKTAHLELPGYVT
ncbi:MAG: carnitine 3-dehydrogenase [Pseudomonadota bacterium]